MIIDIIRNVALFLVALKKMKDIAKPRFVGDLKYEMYACDSDDFKSK